MVTAATVKAAMNAVSICGGNLFVACSEVVSLDGGSAVFLFQQQQQHTAALLPYFISQAVGRRHKQDR
jgi:hypothetical protein